MGPFKPPVHDLTKTVGFMLNLIMKVMIWGSLRFLGFCRPYIHIYISTIYISTYLHFYMSTYLHIYISSQIYISTCLHLYISTYLHINISTYLHIYISTYLLICISTYLHIYISTYLLDCIFWSIMKKVVCIYLTFAHSGRANGRIYTYIQNNLSA